MARQNNYFSTLFAIGFIICMLLSFVLGVFMFFFSNYIGQTISFRIGALLFSSIFLGGLFLIAHFLVKIIEKKDREEFENDILDEGLID